MSNRYASVHQNTKGPGDARPTALQIIQNEKLENTLKDKTVLITGCSSGIGIETARAFAAVGSRLFITARDMKKGQTACSEFLKPGHVDLLELDTSSLASVRACADELLRRSQKLHILVNNAGIMAGPEVHTEDGFEAQFATNYLGHFLLFQLLRPTLLASSTPSFNSRVVNVSSSGHAASGVLFDNYNFKDGSYSPFAAYGQSKTAEIYMTNEIERLYCSKGLHGNSVHPGGISTGLQIHFPQEVKDSWETNKSVKNAMKSTAQGAASTMYAAVSRDLEGKGGMYIEDCGPGEPKKPAKGDEWVDAGYVPHAFDKEKEERLWKDSMQMVGLKGE
ncbi:hypothetical protein MMC28_005308 [Mycoblastus sanguinarius]|nr:hypothetical protein [Mycoblastus sanguinarius]